MAPALREWPQSSGMLEVLPTNVRLGVEQCQVTGVHFNSVTGKYHK